MRDLLLVLIMFFVCCSSVYAQEADTFSSLRKARDQVKERKYDDAIAVFVRAEKDVPVLGDYILLWLSEAYHASGNHEAALQALRSILQKYPDSSLVRRVRSREIKEAGELSGESDLSALFESYLNEYPGDADIRYLYAKRLKGNGRKDRAESLFREVFVEARSFSRKAREELEGEISDSDMTRYASNLIINLEYDAAEKILRDVLPKAEGPFRLEVLQQLGNSLFRQKRYREAAETYKQSGDRYYEMRSLYRAGDIKAIDEALPGMITAGDSRFASILLAVAADKRREGNADEALKIYGMVRESFPFEAEEALWGMGWTLFMKGEYAKASDVFSGLYAIYGETKYLYWKTRSIEKNGFVSTQENMAFSPQNRPDFYQSLLLARTENLSRTQVSSATSGESFPIKKPAVYTKNVRVEALIDLGLPGEARNEMAHIAKNGSSPEEVLYLCSRMKDMKEYRLAVRTAQGIPYSPEVKECLYPVAYRELVEPLSAKHSVDPFLILSIMREESRFERGAKSPAGAIGLMQLMPQTAFALEEKLKLGIDDAGDLTDAGKNLGAGTYYLSRLVEEFGSYPQAIAAYNAGEHIVRKWLQKKTYEYADEFIEDIPYEETRNYVKRVLTSYFEYRQMSSPGAKRPDFFPGKL